MAVRLSSSQLNYIYINDVKLYDILKVKNAYKKPTLSHSVQRSQAY